MQHFKYGRTEIAHLTKRDVLLGDLISRFGKLKRPVNPDLFDALMHAMISQQVSVKAAATVYGRLAELSGKVTPQSIAALSATAIQRCGTTMIKARNMRKASAAFLSGEIDPTLLHTMSDKEVTQALVALPGVGVWTAEMLLLHSLQRPNVFSFNDLIIRRSLMTLHSLPQLTKRDFEAFRELYSPHCSVAMIYLWKYGASMR